MKKKAGTSSDPREQNTSAAGKKKKISILLQIAILFVIGVLLVYSLLSIVLNAFSYAFVISHLREDAQAVSEDLDGFILRFPAHDWLLRYWYEHYDTLDIDYDAPYSADTKTAKQYELLTERHPDFSPEYAMTEEVETLPKEDQKLYAEIVYSWLISRIDLLNETHRLSYVFGLVTEEPYDQLFLLFISGQPDTERGSEPGQVYPIGTELTANKERQEAIRMSVGGKPLFANNEDRKFIDFFYHIGSIDSHEILIGISYYHLAINNVIHENVSVLRATSVICLVLLAVVCLLMLLFVVLRPLKKVQSSIRLYKDTKDSRKVVDSLSRIRSINEIAELSGDVAALTEELDEYMVRNEQITIEKERVKTELELASRIQAAMLPSVFPAYPDRKDFEVYASMTPAKEVGGDFYDFFLVDDRYLCLLIADVSGKGVPAALFMMASKITISHLIKEGKSPAKVLTEANASICSRNPELLFVTVWLGILDLDTGKMTCANAGHEYPILKKPGETYKMIRDKHGFVLGNDEDAKYSEYELQMDPGASLFLYTDGVTESVSPDNRMFGTEQILETLNSAPDRSPEETLRAMKEALDAHVQGFDPFDDLTMLCVAYHGPAHKKHKKES